MSAVLHISMSTGTNLQRAGTPRRTPGPSGRPAGKMPSLPSLSGMLISVIAHAGAAATLVMLAIPDAPPVPEPEPLTIMVEFVSDPGTENEQPQEVQKGDPESVAPEEVAPEENDVEEIEETAEVATFIEPENLPDRVPVPVRRPKPERRKVEERVPDKTTAPTRRGLEEDPRPDIVLGDELKLANDIDASLAYTASRGVTRNVRAEQKWFGRLAAHLERHKRYPHAALSRRKEGMVHVRFVVASDGAIVAPELVSSSGVTELDEEVLDLMRRASPVPKPPPDVNPFVTVPISFTMKR